MATNIKCTAYIGRNACPMRYDCQLYTNFLQHYSLAAIDEVIQKPKTIAVVFIKDSCKNFSKK